MLESIPVTLLVGILLGFLSGLGIGGGSLLILWLTMVLGMDQAAARSINLLFFLPAAVIACFLHWRQGCLNIRKLFPTIAAGTAAAAAASLIGHWADPAVLRKPFGILLLLTALRELLYRPRKPR